MPAAKYISIADCRLCKNIPQKSVEDLEDPEKNPEEGQKIPKEVEKFTTITTIESFPHRYAKSVDKLLKCPLCGTYYYYNHYDDDGEFFMDGTSDDVEVRRYDPLSARNYLAGIAEGAGGSLPKPLGQLKKEFLSGVPFESGAEDEELQKQAQAARVELEELRERYPKLMEDLAEAVATGKASNWHIKKYYVEVLCNYYLVEGKFSEISELLLQHKDPVIKLESARYILGIGTGDAPVVELIHKTGSLTDAAEKFVSKNMDALVNVLYDVAVSKEAAIPEYDWLMGWFKTTTIIKALYGLRVANSHGADIAFAIPGIARLLVADPPRTGPICDTLENFIERRKQGNKKIVLDAINALAKEKPEILSREPVQKVLGRSARKDKKKKPTK